MADRSGWRLPATPGGAAFAAILIEQSDGSIYQPRMDLVGIRTMEFCRAGAWCLRSKRRPPYPRDYAQDNVYLDESHRL